MVDCLWDAAAHERNDTLDGRVLEALCQDFCADEACAAGEDDFHFP